MEISGDHFAKQDLVGPRIFYGFFFFFSLLGEIEQEKREVVLLLGGI